MPLRSPWAGCADPHLVYICVAKHYEYLEKEDGSFNREDYYAHPELYTSKFHEKACSHSFSRLLSLSLSYPSLSLAFSFALCHVLVL